MAMVPSRSATLDAITLHSEKATAARTLATVLADLHWVVDKGQTFAVLVKRSDSIYAKPMNVPTGNTKAIKDPFMPPFEEYLQIETWSSKMYPDRYSMILNKFNVMKNHVLIVTKEFESQFTPLVTADLDVLLEAVRDLDALGFYNAGKEAGPSQSHRHLQVVPREGNEIPFLNLIESRMGSLPRGGHLFVEEFSFKHALLKIVENDRLLDLYHEALRYCDVPLPESGSDNVKAHNLLMGRNWLMSHLGRAQTLMKFLRMVLTMLDHSS